MQLSGLPSSVRIKPSSPGSQFFFFFFFFFFYPSDSKWFICRHPSFNPDPSIQIYTCLECPRGRMAVYREGKESKESHAMCQAFEITPTTIAEGDLVFKQVLIFHNYLSKSETTSKILFDCYSIILRTRAFLYINVETSSCLYFYLPGLFFSRHFVWRTTAFANGTKFILAALNRIGYQKNKMST